MNLLQIGLTTKQFSYPKGSLVITAEPISAQAAKLFDYTKDGLHPLPMQYRDAREFAAALFRDKDLMTYRNGRRALTRLVMKADSLTTIKYGAMTTTRRQKGCWRTFYFPHF